MAIKTLKMGSIAIVKETGFKGEIVDICNGQYSIKGVREKYSAREIRAAEVKPEKKKSQPINKVSGHKRILITIYSTIREWFLSEHKCCAAGLEGCTKNATEVHHMAGKIGLFMIMSQYFLAICPSCHRWITDHSKQAILMGLSLPRTQELDMIFTEMELKLLKKHRVKRTPY